MSDVAKPLSDRREVLRDLVVGGVSCALAALGAISHFAQVGRLHDDYGAEPGPALLPELLLSALAVAGLLLVLRGLLARRKAMSDAPISTVQPARALAALGVTIAFAVLQAYIGFGAAACLLGGTLCAALGRSEGRSLPRSAAEGLAVAAVLYAVFRYLLSVPLT